MHQYFPVNTLLYDYTSVHTAYTYAYTYTYIDTYRFP